MLNKNKISEMEGLGCLRELNTLGNAPVPTVCDLRQLTLDVADRECVGVAPYSSVR